MMVIIILGVICFLSIIFAGLYSAKISSIDEEWSEEVKKIQEKNGKEMDDLNFKLLAEYSTNNDLREKIMELEDELKKIHDRREKVKEARALRPKRPNTRDRKKIEQYVMDYLTVEGIDFKLRNKTNSLLSVYGDRFEIYCGTELYINKKTLEKKHGLKSLVREVKKLQKGEQTDEKR